MPEPNISLAQFNKIATGDYNAGLHQYMMLYGRETARTVLGSPKTFASAITDILFDEFDALSEGLDKKE